MKQLKKEGRVRHIGVSCHGTNWAVDTEENLEACAKKEIATIIMKSNR